MDFKRLETRLGPLRWSERGAGPPLVFYAGAFANHALWRDVIAGLEDRYRCIAIDLPLGAHPWPLQPGADRSASSLARLMLDCLDLLGLEDATVVANDTAGGLLLLSLDSEHPALRRMTRLVLTNCDSYDQFPPDKLRKGAAMCRRTPRLAGALMQLQGRSAAARRRGVATVVATSLDREREDAFFGPGRRDRRLIGDLVAALAGCRPQLLLEATAALRRWDRPVLLVWGDACEFFPMALAQRLAADFPDATLVPVPGAKAWVPVDDPRAVSDAIAGFEPAVSRAASGRAG